MELIIQTIAITITAFVGCLTFLLALIKEVKHSKSVPTRVHYEYPKKFGDYIANYGKGIMTIIDIELLYDGKPTNIDMLSKLYEEKLKKKLYWDTFLDNEEIKNRIIKSQEILRIAELNPQLAINKKIGGKKLLNKLKDMRERIKIKITYKEIYGFKKEIII